MRKDKINIVFCDVGYYHPSNANWNYGIWLIIDEKGAKLYRETFGGDSRIIKKLEDWGYKPKQVYVKETAYYKWQEVKNMLDIEDYRKEELK